jgi:hypothetical protein
MSTTWLARIRRQLSNILGKSKPSSWPPGAVIHDPAAASRPRNLDDPFMDGGVQSRAGGVIARAAQENAKKISKEREEK